MRKCKILLIDNPKNIVLFNEISVFNSINANFHSCTSFSEAMSAIGNDAPDLILIGSGKLMEDFRILVMAKDIPTVILCESDGFEILLNYNYKNVLFLTIPFNLDALPELFNKALEFWLMQKEKS